MASDLRPPVVGDVVAGKYDLVEEIGSGGMGQVFRAVHRRLSTTLAIKVLHPSIAADPELRLRFEREARVLAQIRAPHVVTVLDVDVLPNGLPYIVLEHLTGNDVESQIHAQLGEPLPIGDAVDWVHQAALGMVDTHADGVVHRDLKPSNLFLCDLRPATTRRLVKIVDFGISKVKDDGRLTATSATFGTPLYMSPEQIRSSAHVDERADVWSLGAILFELCTGEPPFLRPSPSAVLAAIIADPLPDPRALRPDLPEELAQILEHALQKDPQTRIPTMQELANALAPFAPAERIARLAASLRAPGYRPPLTPAHGWHVSDFAHLAPTLRKPHVPASNLEETLAAVASTAPPALGPPSRVRGILVLLGGMAAAAGIAVAATSARTSTATPPAAASGSAQAERPASPASTSSPPLSTESAPGTAAALPARAAASVVVDAGAAVLGSPSAPPLTAPLRRKPPVVRDPLAP